MALLAALGAALVACPEPAYAPSPTSGAAPSSALPASSASASSASASSASALTSARAPASASASASAPAPLLPPPRDYVLHDIPGRGACRTAADCVPSDCCGSRTCVAKKDAPKGCNDGDCTQGGLESCTCMKGRCGGRIRFRENSVPNPAP